MNQIYASNILHVSKQLIDHASKSVLSHFRKPISGMQIFDPEIDGKVRVEHPKRI